MTNCLFFASGGVYVELFILLLSRKDAPQIRGIAAAAGGDKGLRRRPPGEERPCG